MAEIIPFETKEARATRLAQQADAPVEVGVVPSVTEAVEGAIPLFPDVITPQSPNVRDAAGLPLVPPVDTRDLDTCTRLIRDRAVTIVRSLVASYPDTYGHKPTEQVKELYTTIADLVALIDCQELLGVQHPYTPAFKQFLNATK